LTCWGKEVWPSCSLAKGFMGEGDVRPQQLSQVKEGKIGEEVGRGETLGAFSGKRPKGEH